MKNNRPKLRIVIGTLEIGGTEVHLSQILPALADRGWLIDLVVLSNTLTIIDRFKHPHIKIIFPELQVVQKRSSLLRRAMRMLQISHFLSKLDWKHPNVITHFFLPEAYILGITFAKLCGCKGPFIMSRRSLNYYQKNRPLLGKYERTLHRHCDLILSNSKAVQYQLMTDEGIPQTKAVTLYNGIDEKRFPPNSRQEYRNQLGYADAPFIITCVANLIPYKGHMDLIEALSEIKEKLPSGWKALFIGHDRGIKATLERKIDQCGLSSHICFIEKCLEPAPYLIASDVGVLPSHQEGFSNALLEMMAAGLPIVATNVGGNSEAIAHGKNGFIVEPFSPKELATALLCLAENGSLRQQFGEESRRLFNEKYTLTQCVEAYEENYRAILP